MKIYFLIFLISIVGCSVSDDISFSTPAETTPDGSQLTATSKEIVDEISQRITSEDSNGESDGVAKAETSRSDTVPERDSLKVETPTVSSKTPIPEFETIRIRTPRAGEFTPDVRKLERYSTVLSDTTNDYETRREALRHVQREPSERAIEILTKTALDDPVEKLQVAAVQAIGQIGNESAIAILESIALDSSKSSKVRAVSRNNIYLIRRVYPMPDPPSVFIQAANLVDISKPFTMAVSAVSPVDRDYAVISVGGGMDWKEVRGEDSVDGNRRAYTGPMEAQEKIQLVVEMQYLPDQIKSSDELDTATSHDSILIGDVAPGVATIPVTLTTGPSELDNTTYTFRLWVDFRSDRVVASMDVPEGFMAEQATEISVDAKTVGDSNGSVHRTTEKAFSSSYLPDGTKILEDQNVFTQHQTSYSSSEGFITVEGRLLYEDGDSIESNNPPGQTPNLANSFFAPAYNVTVEICGVNCGIGLTDPDGNYTVNVKASVGDELTFKVEADNNVLRVYSDMKCGNEWLVLTLPFLTVPPEESVNLSSSVHFNGDTFFAGKTLVSNQEILDTVGLCFWNSDQTIHISTSGYLNIPSVMTIAHDDVMDNRDPSQIGESIHHVAVIYCVDAWAKIIPVWMVAGADNEIWLTCSKITKPILPNPPTSPDPFSPKPGDSGFKWPTPVITTYIPEDMSRIAEKGKTIDMGLRDSLLAHEYYHQVQAFIHAADVGGGAHNFCSQNSQDLFSSWDLTEWNWGSGIELGFSEGTANYFATHITHNKPNMSSLGSPTYKAELPCLDETFDGDISVEGLTTGVLWDLVDDESPILDGWDLVDGSEIDAHRLIMQIMDKELDTDALNLLDDAPDLGNFYKAWIARLGGNAREHLDAILSGHGISANSASFQFPIFTSGPKNAPLPVIAKDLVIPTIKTAFPIKNPQGAIEVHPEYSVEVDMSSSTPFTVTRDYSYIGSNYQKPVIDSVLATGIYTMRQKKSSRFLDAYETVSDDYSAVTRPHQPNDSQRWIIEASPDGTYTIRHKINGRFLDAHKSGADDFSAVTRLQQTDGSQNWIIKADNGVLLASIGLANLNPSSMNIFPNVVEPSSDEADAGNFTINTTPTTASNWVTTSVNSGSFDPRRMTVLDINVLADQIGSNTLTYNATLDIVYQPVSSATPSTKSIDITLNVLDGADDDFDSDGFTSKQEVEDLPVTDPNKWGCLDPSNPDSDGDGLKDGEESGSFQVNGTLPCNPDTDSDLINDGYETKHDCMDPLVHDSTSDPDGDGLSNYKEFMGIDIIFGEEPWGFRTSPCAADSDGDGVNDNVDNCAVTANADQANNDGDDWGDACDLDDDNDKCPDAGDHDPFNAGPEMDCYKLPYSMKVQMGVIDPIRDLIFQPNEEYMVMRVVPPILGGGSWCGRLACPPPHIRIADRGHNVVQELNPEDYRLSMDDGFGLSATWVEDLDGDRVRDLILGIPFAADMDRTGQVGAVLAISTRTGEEIGRINGSIQGSNFGHSIVALGDNHIAVGAPGSGAIGRNAGTVSLIDLEDFSISSVYQTGEQNDGFGHAMFGLPDMDGDGIGELAIGAPMHRSVGSVFLANSNSLNIKLLDSGRSADSSFGFAITSSGDIDGDRVVDLIVSAPNSDGIGSVTMLDLNGDVAWSVTGENLGEMFGSSIAAFKHSDDRSSETSFIVGAPGYGINNGAVYKISARGESQLVTRGDAEQAQLGYSVSVVPGSDRNNGNLFVFGGLNIETSTYQSSFTNEIFDSSPERELQTTRSSGSRTSR